MDSIELRQGRGDELYAAACELVKSTGNAGTAHLQRRLTVGYNRTARMIEAMEADGIVSQPSPLSGRRTVIPEATP